MARPIKETPVLKGNDAKRFIAKMNSSGENSIDNKTKERIKSNFAKLNSIRKG